MRACVCLWGVGALRFLSNTEAALQTLHLYGSAGIAAFGWAMCALLGWRAAPWLPLWFCAALLIYNLDRLRSDPSDAINTPRRVRAGRRLRRASLAAIALSAAALLALPLLARDGLTLALVVVGGVVCANYSLPLLGFRFKDVPGLKTFFAPTIVTAAVFALPWGHEPRAVPPARFIGAAAWAWFFLEYNMILCDLRDIDGDRRCGIVSLPSRLGRTRTRRRLLPAMLLALTALALANASLGKQTAWVLITVCGVAYLAAITIAATPARAERFYEWLVEGMLFLPALAVLLARI